MLFLIDQIAGNRVAVYDGAAGMDWTVRLFDTVLPTMLTGAVLPWIVRLPCTVFPAQAGAPVPPINTAVPLFWKVRSPLTVMPHTWLVAELAGKVLYLQTSAHHGAGREGEEAPTDLQVATDPGLNQLKATAATLEVPLTAPSTKMHVWPAETVMLPVKVPL